METNEFLIFCTSYLKGISHRQRIQLIKKIMTQHPSDLSYQFVSDYSGSKGQQKQLLYQSIEDYQANKSFYYTAFKKAHFLTYFDKEYPELLRQIHEPPPLLYYQGDLDILKTTCLAFIGSRLMSVYGQKVVAHLIPELISHSLTIVSGLAVGVDTCAHEEAIKAGGRTIAVLGTGVNRVYPKENQKLQTYLSKYHLILSEYPPDTGPQKWHFPARNRIIAGLSAGVCLVEAKRKSGSIITAEFALEMGREVFVVPGSILNDKSTGCHDLINDGAKLVSVTTDILSEIP